MSSAARINRAPGSATALLTLPALSSSSQSFSLVSKPIGDNVPWPLPRIFHPLCALVDPDSVWGEGESEGDVKQNIFLLWGRDTRDTVAEEAGIFTLDKGLKEVSWKEVRFCGFCVDMVHRCAYILSCMGATMYKGRCISHLRCTVPLPS